MSFLDLLRGPDRVVAVTDDGTHVLDGARGEWRGAGIEVSTVPGEDTLPVRIRAPQASLHCVQLRWRADPPANLLYLGDAWERGYGDLAWRSLVPERPLPWYFLAYDSQLTHGYGVEVRPNALCCWQVDDAGVSLWLDVACGAKGVRLGARELHACTVATRRGVTGETAWAAAHRFLSQLCRDPRLPAEPVYGANDWYYAYGRNTADGVLRDASIVAELSPSKNRPFQVIDAGWAKHEQREGASGAEGGPWSSNAQFGDMAALATGIRSRGARPGIWYRPLLWEEDVAAAERLPERFPHERGLRLLDPTVPAVLDRVRADVARIRGWGYELIKHDFSTFDLFGRWGFQMGFQVTTGTWSFADRSRTSAEAVLALYQALREAAGDAILIGCNTIGHLAAGLVEIQRTGDDTSGRVWERTRKMGVNTLAFRSPQHGTFFAADADCVGLTTAIPWELNRQWLDALARSGTPLFVSAAADAVGAEQRESLRAAFTRAAEPQPTAEPIDWLYSTAPSYWRSGDESVRYDWYGEDGVRVLDAAT